MSEQLRLNPIDGTILLQVRHAVLTARTVRTLAVQLSRIEFFEAPGERSVLSWHEHNRHIPSATSVLIGLRLAPERYAEAAARLLWGHRPPAIHRLVAELSRAGPDVEMDLAPEVLLAYASPLYRGYLLGGWPGLSPRIVPYDGALGIADAVGGACARDAGISATLGPDDAARIAQDLAFLDRSRLPAGSMRGLREYWELAIGGLDTVDQACEAALEELSRIYADLAAAGRGARIRR